MSQIIFVYNSRRGEEVVADIAWRIQYEVANFLYIEQNLGLVNTHRNRYQTMGIEFDSDSDIFDLIDKCILDVCNHQAIRERHEILTSSDTYQARVYIFGKNLNLGTSLVNVNIFF